jgi:hypothetical protein
VSWARTALPAATKASKHARAAMVMRGFMRVPCRWTELFSVCRTQHVGRLATTQWLPA